MQQEKKIHEENLIDLYLMFQMIQNQWLWSVCINEKLKKRETAQTKHHKQSNRKQDKQQQDRKLTDYVSQKNIYKRHSIQMSQKIISCKQHTRQEK